MKFQKTRLTTAIDYSLKALALMALATSVHAQVQDLGTVTVTETKDVSPAVAVTDSTGMQHNVLTQEQIEKQVSLDVGTALRNVPGVLHQSGTIIGNQAGANVYVRGRGASHPSADLNIMFDGVPRMGALYGQSFFEGVALGSIGSIDIYKNPQPGAFGSGYAAIDMKPRVMENEGFEAEVDLAGGSHQTYQESISMGYKHGAFDIYAAQDWTSTDGHVDHSRAQQGNLYLNMGWAFNDHWNIRWLLNQTQAQTQDPKFAVAGTRYDIETTFSTLTLNHRYDKAEGYVKAYWSDTDYDLLNEEGKPGVNSRQDITLYGVRAKEKLTLWDRGEVVLGFDLDKTELKNKQFKSGSTTHWDFPDTTLFTPYITVSHQFGDESFSVTPSVGVRAYDHSEFDDAVGAQAGLVLKSGDFSVHTNYARGVNYPSVVVQQAFVQVGNEKTPEEQYGWSWADMKPEIVDHYEIGLRYQVNSVTTVSATAFYDEGKDRFVAWMGLPGKPMAPTPNGKIDKYEIKGFELAAQTSLADCVNLFAAATYMDVKAKGEDGKEMDYMPYTPEWQLQVGGTWHIDSDWKLYGDMTYLNGLYSGTALRGPMYGNGYNKDDYVKLDDVFLANVRLSRSIEYPQFGIVGGEAYVAINNLFDQDYEMMSGYPMPGITVLAGVKLRF